MILFCPWALLQNPPGRPPLETARGLWRLAGGVAKVPPDGFTATMFGEEVWEFADDLRHILRQGSAAMEVEQRRVPHGADFIRRRDGEVPGRNRRSTSRERRHSEPKTESEKPLPSPLLEVPCNQPESMVIIHGTNSLDERIVGLLRQNQRMPSLSASVAE